VAYNNILHNFLGRSDGITLKLSVDDIFGLLNINDAAIDSLNSKDTSNSYVGTHFRLGNNMLLLCF
jgi:hypothetical protein